MPSDLPSLVECWLPQVERVEADWIDTPEGHEALYQTWLENERMLFEIGFKESI